jgi:SAM-dependent methyltransferase
MNLQDVSSRELPPEPWKEGEKIPWNDAEFSHRMLKEHLSQEHNMASRRQDIIDRQVQWIHRKVLHEDSSRILDLACGPGFYTQRLAGLGHSCLGIDFSPASIEYARLQSKRAGLDIDYRCGDIRTTASDKGIDLAMMIFGEFNVFSRQDAQRLLASICRKLKPGGCLLLEPQTYVAIRQHGESPSTWQTQTSGLFSAAPHFWLEEHFWHADIEAATTRYFIIDAFSHEVNQYASTSKAYSDSDLDQMLDAAGFNGIVRHPSLTGNADDLHEGLFVLEAHRAA